jgi:hypothetical protein
VEGIRQSSLLAAGKRVLRALPASERGGVSTWDASGVFFELARASSEEAAPSAKTLLMLYACDLAFRLRWEIRPVLNRGKTVVAAPYVLTALALGQAAGIPRDWLENLFAFAPEAEVSYRWPEPDPAAWWAGRKMGGFVEFACSTLAESSEVWVPADLIARALGGFSPNLAAPPAPD